MTQNKKREIKRINIGVKNGRIEYLGTEALPSYKKINAKEYIILPGFLNGHIHFGEYYLRGYKENLSTEDYILLGENFYNKFRNINDKIRNSSINNVVFRINTKWNINSIWS